MVTFVAFKATGLLLVLTRAATAQLNSPQTANSTQTNTTQMNFLAAIGGVAFDNSTSPACIAAINSSLSCPSQFTNYPISDYAGPFTMEALDSFCSGTCTASISQYQSSVYSSCKGSRPFQEFPATLAVDRMAAYQRRTCLKDASTGQYCHSKFDDAPIESHFPYQLPIMFSLFRQCRHPETCLLLDRIIANVKVPTDSRETSQNRQLDGEPPPARRPSPGSSKALPMLQLSLVITSGFTEHSLFQLRRKLR